MRYTQSVSIIHIIKGNLKRGAGIAQSVSGSVRAVKSGDQKPVGGRDFLHPSRTALGPTKPPAQQVPFSFLGAERPERGVDHPTLPSAEVKERSELYLYSLSGPSWSVIG
jgi:hypothetical protein